MPRRTQVSAGILAYGLLFTLTRVLFTRLNTY